MRLRFLPPAATLLATLLAVSALSAADLRFAHGLYRDKRYQPAAAEYKAFLAENADDPKADEARYFLAESLVQLKKYDDAAAAYEAVSRSARDYRTSALFRAGALRKRLGQTDQCERSLEQFVAEFSDHADAPGAWLMLAECRLAAKRFSAAQDALKRAKPTIDAGGKWSGRLQLVEAEVLKENGRADRAVEILNSLASSNDPLASEAALRLGAAQFAAKQFKEAAVSFDRAAAANKDAGAARRAGYNAALAYLELKQWRQAETRLQPLSNLMVADGDEEGERLVAQAGQALVQAKLGAGDLVAARTLIDDALRRLGREPASWEFKRLSATLDLLDGKSASAASTLRVLLREMPADADRAAVLMAALQAAAAVGDSPWALELLQAIPTTSGRKSVEAALADGNWKDAKSAEKVLEHVADPVARARLNYRLSALDLHAAKPAQAVERLRSLLETADLSVELRANANYALGGALLQLNRWNDGLAPLEEYLSFNDAIDRDAQLTAARWWAKCLTALSDADAQQRIGRLAKKLDRTTLQAVAGSIAGERRSQLALWLLSQIPRPESKTAATIAARCLVDLKKPKEALQKLPNPSTAEERYLAGVAQLQMGTKESISMGRALLAHLADAEPATPWSLDAAIRLARAANSTSEAEQAERRLVRLESSAQGADRRRLRLESAFLASANGRALQAIAALKAIVEDEKASPEAVEAALKLAELHESRGETQLAEAAIAAAKEMDPAGLSTSALQFRSASLAFRAREWSEAGTLLKEFLDKNPNHELAAAAALMLGETALERQSGDEAVRRFESLRDHADPVVRATALLRLSQALVLARNYDEAEETAKKFLALAEQSADRAAEAHYVVGRSLMNLAKFNEARKAFESAVGDDASELAAKARFMIGETYFHQKRFDAAMKEYLKVAVLGMHPDWQAAALLQVGKCHENLGDHAAAAADYRRILDRFPSAPAAKQAKERLQEVELGARKSDRDRVKE